MSLFGALSFDAIKWSQRKFVGYCSSESQFSARAHAYGRVHYAMESVALVTKRLIIGIDRSISFFFSANQQEREKERKRELNIHSVEFHVALNFRRLFENLVTHLIWPDDLLIRVFFESVHSFVLNFLICRLVLFVFPHTLSSSHTHSLSLSLYFSISCFF